MTVTTTPKSLFDDAELAAILGDDEFAEPAAIDVENIEPEDLGEALQEIEIDEELRAALEDKPADVETLTEDPTAVFEEPIVLEAVKEAKLPTAPRAKSSRGSGISGMLPSEAATVIWGPSVAEDGLPLSSEPTELTALDGLAKKVKEKAVNAMECAKKGTAPSVYTQRALAILKEKGSMTAAELKADYLARPYSEGTASAQTSQMMIVLPALKIATRAGNTLTLNPESTLFPLLANNVGAESTESESGSEE